MAARNTTSLFTQFLNVVNAALAKHGDSMPYRALLRASDEMLDGRKLGVAVYESDANAPFDYFTIRYRERSFEFVSHGKEDPDVAWKVSQDYLEKVVENADDYIEHPVKLDWEWLKSRVGIGGD